MKRTIQIIGFLFLINIILSFSCSKPIDRVGTPTPPPTFMSALQHNWILDSVEIYENAQLKGYRVKWTSFGGNLDFRADNKAYGNDSVQIHDIRLSNIYDTFNYSLSSDNRFLFTNLIHNGIPFPQKDTSTIFLLSETELVFGLTSLSPIDSSYVYGLSPHTNIYPKFYYHR